MKIAKKPYEAPLLVVHGNVAEITGMMQVPGHSGGGMIPSSMS